MANHAMTRHKYRAIPTTVDGIRFASKLEATRYRELRLLERSGQISGLRQQIVYPLEVCGHTVASYVADFDYYDHEGAFIIEDVKGMRTPVYRLKKKLFEALYDETITEWPARPVRRTRRVSARRRTPSRSKP